MIKKLSLSAIMLAMMLFSIIFISASYATVASAAMVDDAPNLYCTYEDENGNEVNGNKLTAGTYTINFVANGLERLAVAEVTAVIDEGATVDSIDYLISEDTALVSMGTVNSDGNLVFGFVPDENSNYIEVNGAVTLASATVTFDQPCDAENYISFSTNPNLTFIVPDYSNGTDDEYALVDTFDGYNGDLGLMGYDVTPSIAGSAHSVSANLVIMTSPNGASDNVPVRGTYTVDVYSDMDRTELVTSAESQFVTINNTNYNTFVIDNLEDGTYYATISSDYAVTHDKVIINVNGNDISGQNIPMIACDFDSNSVINSLDFAKIYAETAGSGDLVCDLDGNSVVNSLDFAVVYSCATSSEYQSITIE